MECGSHGHAHHFDGIKEGEKRERGERPNDVESNIPLLMSERQRKKRKFYFFILHQIDGKRRIM